MFKGRERMAAVVTRWSTTPHHHKQTIAEHSFYVALYTDFLCQLIRLPHSRKYQIVHWALIHDMPETVLSDTPGPVKRATVNEMNFRAAESQVFGELGSGYDHDDFDKQARGIVKVANLIDEVFYLHMERLMGNQFIERVFQNSWARMIMACRDAGMPTELSNIIKVELDAMMEGVVSLITVEDPHARAS